MASVVYSYLSWRRWLRSPWLHQPKPSRPAAGIEIV
jgi:hypothetical protein